MGAAQKRAEASPLSAVLPGSKKAMMLGKSFLAGCIASCGAVAVTNPVDVVRTRLELQGELAKGLGKMVLDEGPTVLWRGLKPAFAFQIAVNGTRLGIFIPLKKWLVAHREQHGMDDFLTSLIAGAGAGMMGAAIGTPFQLIKTRMQAAARGSAVVARQPYRGLGHALASIVKNEGLFGLYRGAHLNMVKIAVASAVQLAVFDCIKARLQQEQRWGQEHPTVALLVAAMTAGLAVTAVVQPVDVITTRLWNQPVVNGVGMLYCNAWECVAKTVMAEGPQALYKGCTAHFLRAGPHTVLTLLLLDRMQCVLGLQVLQQQAGTVTRTRQRAAPPVK